MGASYSYIYHRAMNGIQDPCNNCIEKSPTKICICKDYGKNSSLSLYMGTGRELATEACLDLPCISWKRFCLFIVDV